MNRIQLVWAVFSNHLVESLNLRTSCPLRKTEKTRIVKRFLHKSAFYASNSSHVLALNRYCHLMQDQNYRAAIKQSSRLLGLTFSRATKTTLLKQGIQLDPAEVALGATEFCDGALIAPNAGSRGFGVVCIKARLTTV
jgi:hypothetical protein